MSSTVVILETRDDGLQEVTIQGPDGDGITVGLGDLLSALGEALM